MRRTALNETHRELGARLVDFAGWEMPLLYRGIIEEHLHTRCAASVFDVSHMGRLIVRGPDAIAALDRVCTRNVSRLAVGRSGYSHLCNEQGGILDDVIVSRAEDRCIVVCNASNREKVAAHFRRRFTGLNVELDDQTGQTAMLAVQGPAVLELFRSHVPLQTGDLRRYGFVTGTLAGMEYTLFRSGYTGEDGYEAIVPAAAAVLAWQFMTEPGGDERPTVLPAGLGARDTLRLEAGMPLYGHELHEEIDPLSAGCGWAVDLEKDFVGAAALREIARRGPVRKLAGLVLDGRRAARQGAAVFDGGRPIGEVTSGCLGPTIGRPIAMAYLDAERAARAERWR